MKVLVSRCCVARYVEPNDATANGGEHLDAPRLGAVALQYSIGMEHHGDLIGVEPVDPPGVTQQRPLDLAAGLQLLVVGHVVSCRLM